MTFFTENKLFIMGTVLLAALIAGAAGLQHARDEGNLAQVPLAQAPAQESAAVSSALGVAPAAASVAEVAPAEVSPDPQASVGARPAIQGVSGDDEEEDDD